mmetsp:Transcript_2737/g.8231  ORF Transcript_2737/g.8231 Transcript_2737/m.8231 type:complete len:224 (+) Transcript_2737:397-1068(+)
MGDSTKPWRISSQHARTAFDASCAPNDAAVPVRAAAADDRSAQRASVDQRSHASFTKAAGRRDARSRASGADSCASNQSVENVARAAASSRRRGSSNAQSQPSACIRDLFSKTSGATRPCPASWRNCCWWPNSAQSGKTYAETALCARKKISVMNEKSGASSFGKKPGVAGFSDISSACFMRRFSSAVKSSSSSESDASSAAAPSPWNNGSLDENATRSSRNA